MIIRFTQKLATKIKAPKLEYLEPSEEAILDWTANIFTAGKKQYILFTNSETLFSIIFPSAGINNSNKFIASLKNKLSEMFTLYRINSKVIDQLLDFNSIEFSKNKDKSILGSMNEFVFQIKFYMSTWKLDSIQSTLKINSTIMGKINYDKPIDRFLKIIDE